MHLDFACDEDTNKIFYFFLHLLCSVWRDIVAVCQGKFVFFHVVDFDSLATFFLSYICGCFLFNRVTVLLICVINARWVLSVLFMKSLSVQSILQLDEGDKKTLWHLIMDRTQLSQGCSTTKRRQFTFNHQVLRDSWYSFDWPQRDGGLIELGATQWF